MSYLQTGFACDNCIKASVCKYKEKFIEDVIKMQDGEDALCPVMMVDIRCKEQEKSMPTLLRRSIEEK